MRKNKAEWAKRFSINRRTRTSGEYFSLMVSLRLLFRLNSKLERLKTSVAGSDASSVVPS